MGSAHSSYVTPETAITALVVVGAVALGYNQIPTSSKDATGAGAPSTTTQKKGKKVKGKTKAVESEPTEPPPTDSVQGASTPGSVAASTSLPGQFDEDGTPPTSATKKNKKKGKKPAPGDATPSFGQSVSASIDYLNTSEIQLAASKTPGAPGQFDADSTSASKKNKKKGKRPAAAKEAPGDATPSLDNQSVSASIDYLNASEIALVASKTPGEGEGEGKKKKKKGKGAAATPSTASPSASQSLSSPQAPSSKADAPAPKAVKGAKTPKAQPASSSVLPGPTVSSTSLDTDGSWTRVGVPRRGKGAASASAEVSAAEHTTASGTGTSSPVVSRSGADDASVGEDEEEDEDEEAKPGEEREFLLSAAARASGETRKTLAERLVPKPRKTHVEDMLTKPDHPTLARVVRVRPGPDEKPAQGFTWGDYEDVRAGDDADAEGDGGAAENVGDNDDGWGVVASRKSKRVPNGLASTPAHKATKAPETMTKKQRQNHQRNEESKAAKAAAEAERLAALAKHKRQLENERIKEQFGTEGKGSKKQSGGMVASVDEKGRLVWE